MNILYIHRTQSQGVEGVHIRSIANSFVELGHSVTVVSPTGVHHGRLEETISSESSSSESSAVQSISVKTKLYRLISRYLPELIFEFIELAYNAVLYRQIKRSCASGAGVKPDFIYERYAIFSIAGVLFSKKNNIPIMLEVNYTSCSPLVRKRSAILKPLARYIDRKTFAAADTLVVVSSYLREHLINDYAVEPGRIMVCTNAADPAKFTTEIKPITEVNGVNLQGKKIIGFVGTFSPWHGVHLLVDAFERVSQQYSDAVMLLVGDGPEKSAIMQKVISYNLNERVLFAGNVKHDNLPQYVASFSIGVMPDSNEYGSPMKIFEYMAMGKPVVVPDYVPLKDSVEHGKQGIIFERKNVDSMAQSFAELLEDEHKLQQMGKQARDHIVTEHNWLSNARSSLEFAMKCSK